MHFPERIPIGGMIYTLELRKRILDGDELVDGLCLFAEKKLLLLTRYATRELALEVFDHETNEAIVQEYVIRITHDDLERLSQGQAQVDLAEEAARRDLGLDTNKAPV
jgi:hypothetical protein